MHTNEQIQVIDGAENTVYVIFAATDEEFDLIFPSGQDIAFSEEVWNREPKALLEAAFCRNMETTSTEARCEWHPRRTVLWTRE